MFAITKPRRSKSVWLNISIAGLSWDIVKNSDPFQKMDSKTMDFDGEKTVTYKDHCRW
ncbi:MAG TPA: hypothetical protein VF740_12550 [Candidatus Acidoferrum sp.]